MRKTCKKRVMHNMQFIIAAQANHGTKMQIMHGDDFADCRGQSVSGPPARAAAPGPAAGHRDVSHWHWQSLSLGARASGCAGPGPRKRWAGTGPPAAPAVPGPPGPDEVRGPLALRLISDVPGVTQCQTVAQADTGTPPAPAARPDPRRRGLRLGGGADGRPARRGGSHSG